MSYPNSWKEDSLTLDQASEELTSIAVQVRGALLGLGLCYQAKKSGEVREVQFKALDLVADGDRPVLGLLVIDTAPGALPPRLSIDKLCNDRVLHHLSAVVGRPVLRFNSTGLVYATLFQEPDRPAPLPRTVALDLGDKPNGRYRLALGQSVRGGEWWKLEDLCHLMVAGNTRSGKSTFLRSLVYQVLHWREPVQLYLADMVGSTFAPLARVRHLGQPVARDIDSVMSIGQAFYREIAKRDQLYLDAPGYPETLSEYHRAADPDLPLLLWVVDEAPAFLLQAGGRNGDLAKLWTDLAQRGAKYGIHLVLSGTDWRADSLPPALKSEMVTRAVFRYPPGADAIRTVLGPHRGPDKIKFKDKGRAFVLFPDAYREIQGHMVEKAALIRRCDRLRTGPRALSEAERDLVRYAVGHLSGRFIIGDVAAGTGLAPVYNLLGSRYQVMELARRWERRGLLSRDERNVRGHRMGRAVTERLKALAEA